MDPSHQIEAEDVAVIRCVTGKNIAGGHLIRRYDAHLVGRTGLLRKQAARAAGLPAA